MADTTNPARPKAPPAPTTPDEIRALLRRAQEGDESTCPVVRTMLEHPAALEAFGGNLAGRVVAGFIAALGGTDVGFREAVLMKLDGLRAELLGASPSAVERLLVERALACWLQLQHAELRYVNNLKELTIPQGDYHQRRMDAAHRRYLAALKALALVRKLAAPALQVNIAKKQVNVVVPSVPAT